MFRGMSDETLDGIVYGMRLAANPKLRARQEDYERRVNECLKEAALMTPGEVVSRLVQHMPSYIAPQLLESQGLRDRYARTFFKRA